MQVSLVHSQSVVRADGSGVYVYEVAAGSSHSTVYVSSVDNTLPNTRNQSSDSNNKIIDNEEV